MSTRWAGRRALVAFMDDTGQLRRIRCGRTEAPLVRGKVRIFGQKQKIIADQGETDIELKNKFFIT